MGASRLRQVRGPRPSRLAGALALALEFVGTAFVMSESLAATPSSSVPARSAPVVGSTPPFANSLPGAPAPDAELVRRLMRAWAARAPGYVPRTRHLNPDGTPKYMNRLFLESSPYLRQHSHNPVNWYAWGGEAFARARLLHRPVFLSVGYSTCHWCHVMEEESFEDEEIAQYLNENYVAIKVDREERPDIDAVYMRAVEMLSGTGGWPMSVWLTPDRRPYYGGTYFPARDGDRGVPVGFFTLLRRLRQAYDQQPDRVAESAAQITQGIRHALADGSGADSVPGTAVLTKAFHAYEGQFDATHGGLSEERKFPSSLPIRFLLHYYRRTGETKALAMARLTLEKMAAGGMYDQVGGGFHRYSTDSEWLIPHFEKMLYDNALLEMDYLEGWQVTADPRFARIAREILRYVQRDMTSPEGAFYSATDADSRSPSGQREEGWFYTWTRAELESVLGLRRAKIVEQYFGVTEQGNFNGRNLPFVPHQDEQMAAALGLSLVELQKVIATARESLYSARSRRPRPLRDEKVLAAWNGLMISAHARAAIALAEPEYARRAARAADFVLAKMRRNGELLRSFKDGQGRYVAYLDDYAFMIAGLIDLYEATGEVRWLRGAIGLDSVLARRYEDEQGGAYYMTGTSNETLLAREKPGNDGPEPSGNSIEALNLLRLAEFTGDDRYRVRGERQLKAFAKKLARSPTALSEMLLAVDFQTDLPKEVVIVTRRSRDEAKQLLGRLGSTYVPNRILAIAIEGSSLAQQSQLVPLLEGKVAQGGRPTAYVCERGICELPTSDPIVFARQLAKVRRLSAARVEAHDQH